MDSEWSTASNKRTKSSSISNRSAYSIEKSENVIGLARTLLSAESITLQQNGNKYVGVWREEDPYDEDLYIYLPTGNKYGDKLKYMKDTFS